MAFAGLSVLPGDPPVELDGIEAALAETGAGVHAVEWRGLASDKDPDDRPMSWVLKALRRMRCPLLIVTAARHSPQPLAQRGARVVARVRAGEQLDGDEAVEELSGLLAEQRGQGLESLARALHHLHQVGAGLRVALAPEASPAGLLDPESLGQLLEDPSLAWLELWHDVGVVETRRALGLDEPGQWLECRPERIAGASLQDWAEGRERLVPGQGVVDWALLAEYLPRDAQAVLALAPSYPVEAVHEARLALAAYGIR